MDQERSPADVSGAFALVQPVTRSGEGSTVAKVASTAARHTKSQNKEKQWAKNQGIGSVKSRPHTAGLIGRQQQAQGSDQEEVAGVEPRVPDRTQEPWGMTTLASGGPPDSPVRQSTTEGRAAVRGISALVRTRGKVIELAGEIYKRPVSMLIDSGSTGNYVTAQTRTMLGIHIEEEPTNEELQLADGSPVTTQGRVKLHIKYGKYENVIWARVFPHMQKQLILGMPWSVQEDPNIKWSHRTVTMVRWKMVESTSNQGQTGGTYRYRGQPMQCNTSTAVVQEGQNRPSFPWGRKVEELEEEDVD